jgi:hypothetical protein
MRSHTPFVPSYASPSGAERMLNGNRLILGAHEKDIVDAFGPDVIKYVQDFVVGNGLSATSLGNDWTVTLVNSSTVALTDASGGALLLTTDTAENDGVNMQLLGESFNLAGSGIKALSFVIRFKISDATQSDFFVGLCDTDTDILTAADDSIGFRKADGSTSVSFVTEKGTTETTATALTMDTGNHKLAFYYDGVAGNLQAFVDDVSIGYIATTNLPDEEQRVSIQFLAGAAAAKTMQIDYIRCIQIGGRAA